MWNSYTALHAQPLELMFYIVENSPLLTSCHRAGQLQLASDDVQSVISSPPSVLIRGHACIAPERSGVP